jgi:hypothetical protein
MLSSDACLCPSTLDILIIFVTTCHSFLTMINDICLLPKKKIKGKNYSSPKCFFLIMMSRIPRLYKSNQTIDRLSLTMWIRYYREIRVYSSSKHRSSLIMIELVKRVISHTLVLLLHHLESIVSSRSMFYLSINIFLKCK